ncbi:hypothetical protein HYC85_017932 [Camellia sinensis]|uniref:Uncharacterized protein n=1 Tax=Camellia sinensis TaxID=4442 RepID=A0A7J7GUH6_CAMSI|nr:hypothetical protein HYC85_017932 [Camellia sinensis]
MKNTIRCCISCILPCGALDVIRIVHANGRVEEISGTIRAAEIMKAHPKHVLKKPSSPSDGGCCPRIVIVPARRRASAREDILPHAGAIDDTGENPVVEVIDKEEKERSCTNQCEYKYFYDGDNEPSHF